jgi:Ca2+-binding RTX toxin-like protein
LTIARLALQGNNGNDLLLGSVGRDVLSAGRGNDEARGGKGRDILRLDGGHDAGYAGPGRDSIYIVSDVGSVPPDDNRDLIFAGSGDDEVESAGNGFADRVACGRGRDRALVDSADRRRNCERVTVR